MSKVAKPKTGKEPPELLEPKEKIEQELVEFDKNFMEMVRSIVKLAELGEVGRVDIQLEKADIHLKNASITHYRRLKEIFAIHLKHVMMEEIEEHFPKGKCEERGKAIVLVATTLLKFEMGEKLKS